MAFLFAGLLGLILGTLSLDTLPVATAAIREQGVPSVGLKPYRWLRRGVSVLWYLIASLAPRPRTAMIAGQFLFLMMMFLSGVFAPVTPLPESLQAFVQILPVPHLSPHLRRSSFWCPFGGAYS